jgi:predicted RNase H-like HicB family nuclease
MIEREVWNMELTANIHQEDGAYWADVPELPGCFASGETFDELFDSLREGVRLYLEDDDRRNSASPLQIKAAVLSDSAAV